MENSSGNSTPVFGSQTDGEKIDILTAKVSYKSQILSNLIEDYLVMKTSMSMDKALEKYARAINRQSFIDAKHQKVDRSIIAL